MTRLAEDRELLASFRDGHPDALDQIYRHFAPRVAGFLRTGFSYASQQRAMTFPGISSPFELESAVQEVFARAFAPAARLAYDGVRPYASFLYGIARNVALGELRRRARHGETLAPAEVVEQLAGAERELPAPADAAGEGFEDELDRRRAAELVKAFLASECDKRDHALYELRYGQELSQEAAASHAGLTRIQVRRWETRFRKRLLRYLKRADYVR